MASLIMTLASPSSPYHFTGALFFPLAKVSSIEVNCTVPMPIPFSTLISHTRLGKAPASSFPTISLNT